MNVERRGPVAGTVVGPRSDGDGAVTPSLGAAPPDRGAAVGVVREAAAEGAAVRGVVWDGLGMGRPFSSSRAGVAAGRDVGECVRAGGRPRRVVGSTCGGRPHNRGSCRTGSAGP